MIPFFKSRRALRDELAEAVIERNLARLTIQVQQFALSGAEERSAELFQQCTQQAFTIAELERQNAELRAELEPFREARNHRDPATGRFERVVS